MLQLQLYIEGQEVELYKDESVTLTQTLQNVRDISKIFTDFSRTFNVPASKENNKIFKHFYNPDIDGYKVGIKKVAELYLNHQLFKKGKVKLEGATTKNNKAHTYRLTFFGDTVNIKDLLGDLTIGSLNIFRDFEMPYDSTNIVGMMDTPKDFTADGVTYEDALLVPLITHTDRLFYNSSSILDDTGNLYWNVGTNNGVKFEELKPALRLDVIIRAMERKFTIANGYSQNLKFSRDFFNEDNPIYYDLFIWLHREKGGILDQDTFREQVRGFTGQVFQGDDSREKLEDDITQDSWIVPDFDEPDNVKQSWRVIVRTNSTTRFNVIIEKDGEVFEAYDNILHTVEIGGIGRDYAKPSGEYTIHIETSAAADFTFDFSMQRQIRGIIWRLRGCGWTGFLSTSEKKLQVSQQTPTINSLEVLTGLFKMFNLTAYQDTNGEVIVKPLDDYYRASSTTYDISEYVDNTETAVESMIPYSRIIFKYEGQESFFAADHLQRFNTEWATEKYSDNTKYEGDSYEIEIPFEHHKFERLFNAANNTVTDIQWGWSVDDNKDPYLGKPLLFYPKKITNGTPISVRTSLTTKVQKTSYFVPSNSVELTKSQNLNFKAEINEYGLEVYPDTLFNTYYKKYIKEVFNQNRRLFKIKAYLPLKVLLNFTLADKFIIYDKLYKINTITTDFTNGLSNLELINEVTSFSVENVDGNTDYSDVADTTNTMITCDQTDIKVDAAVTI